MKFGRSSLISAHISALVTSTITLTFVLLITGCNKKSSNPSDVAVVTRNEHAAQLQRWAHPDPEIEADTQRGRIASASGKILADDGSVLVDFDAFRFLQGPAPQSVNPSLWQHSVLNAQAGLFKVTDGIYQVRGFDIANMTLIDGDSGWIVVDPLTSRESASAALSFARQHLGNKQVSTIIFTHSHADHFGGVLGVVSAQEVAQRRLPVIAPQGFMEEATSENVLVGTAMARRSAFQFGKDLERSAKGMVDTGLGKAVAYGHVGILEPNQLISAATQALRIDGVDFVFHAVPGAEAPAELTFSIPTRHAYCGAEILAQTMHNLLPIRGAKVRDALRWSDYLDQALEQVDGAEVYFGQHNWPVWGHARIVDFITKQRDVYKYTHDQTVRLINAGYTPREIAEMIKLPKSLDDFTSTHGYYGDLRHNVKAVYQFYLGNYDGNPANLNPLPPRESARHYVELMGGPDRVAHAAHEAYERGEYRWVAELLNQLVLAYPDHADGKELLAKAFEQLGYQAESATWRNSYLTGAQELRLGAPAQGVNRAMLVEMLMQTPTERFLEAMAAGLDGPAAEGKQLKIHLVLTDVHESYMLWIENAVLHFRRAEQVTDANASLILTKTIFIRMMAGTAGVNDTLLSPDLKIEGSRLDLLQFFRLIDKAKGNFAIVGR